MDVGELSNAAGSLESGTAVFGTGSSARGHIIDKATHIIANNTLGNSQSGGGGVAAWWTSPSSQTIVGGNTSGDVMNQLCRVCGEPAAGFHFGAFTCEGCKSFFGRTYNNIGSISECKNGGVCVINKKNRTACKACRLRKCLMVGMSKSGSRYGRRSNWFKIHCLLQEQSHQVQQARLKDPTKSSFDKVLSSLDTANNNNTPNSPAVPGVSPSPLHGRLLSEEPRDQSPRSSIHRPEALPELLNPEAIRFPIWRTPPFFHPTLSHMQFLGAPFFPFQQRFMVPYVNQVEPQISVNISSSSSDSVSSRSSPIEDPKEEENRSEDASSDKNTQFFKCLGPEQDEPMDLSKKSILVEAVRENNSTAQLENLEKTGDIESDNESVINETETGPPLDLSWKT